MSTITVSFHKTPERSQASFSKNIYTLLGKDNLYGWFQRRKWFVTWKMERGLDSTGDIILNQGKEGYGPNERWGDDDDGYKH